MTKPPPWIKSKPAPPAEPRALVAPSNASDAELVDLLHCIDPGCGIDKWKEALGAFFTATRGAAWALDAADHWSSRGHNYTGRKDVAAWWRTFKDPSGNTNQLGALAKEFGGDVVEIGRKHRPEDFLPEHDVVEAAEANERLRLGMMARQEGDGQGAAKNSTVYTQLPTISAVDFEGMAKPVRRFLVPDLVPDRNVTILSGDGGTGKSLLAMQLGVAVTSGTKWLSLPVESGPCLYLSAEDDETETHIRLKDICEAEGLHLPASLRIAIMAGEDCLLAIENTKTARMDKTPIYHRLRASIEAMRPRLVVLDNVADIFGGNENIKALVRQFIGMIRNLAIAYDCAVLMLAHPSLSGMSSGTGSSGNVAWNNSVRSRVYLKRQHDDPKEITDPDFRKLVSMKANYAAAGGEIGMRWERGRFVPTETPATAAGTIDRMAIQSKAERVFLALVHRFSEEGRNLSAQTGHAYAPFLFAKHPDNEGVTKRQFEIAMDTLFGAARIKIVESGPPSKLRKNIVIDEGENIE